MKTCNIQLFSKKAPYVILQDRIYTVKVICILYA
jgi:hypothetical protein